MKLAVVIPAYNEAATIQQVIDQVPTCLDGISEIQTIVVNDGSQDSTSALARKSKALVLNHRINLGVGAATLTGLKAARLLNHDFIVTLDGDGQHDPKEIITLLPPLFSGEADLVIGSRLLSKKSKIPLIRLIGNHLLNQLTYLFYGIKTSDSQSGFRAYSKKSLDLLDLKTNGYEICSEILAEAARLHLKIKEVPISVVYNRYTQFKGQTPLNGLNIVLRLLWRKFLMR